MYLLLRADQRLKQNQEDLSLLAHLQELYLFVKDFGLILSQELDRLSLTQCQKRLSKVVSIYARRLGAGQWSFLGPGSEKKWYSVKEDSPQGIWDKIAERMLLELAESGCPLCRATTPLSRVSSKAKDTENCRFTVVPTKKQLKPFFA